MGLLESLHIAPYEVVGQVANFAILAFILWKVLWSPLLKAVDARRADAARGQEDAAAAANARAEAEAAKAALLADARAQAATMVAEARAQATAEATALHAAKEKEIHLLKARALEEISAGKRKAAAEVREHAVALALQLVEKTLPGAVPAAQLQTQLEKSLQTLKNAK